MVIHSFSRAIIWYLKDYIDDLVSTNDLIMRLQGIYRELAALLPSNDKKRSQLLSEAQLINNTLAERYIKARLSQGINGKSIFISHSSKDKRFARMLATDLVEAGHQVWLDEWEIRAGQSIPKESKRLKTKCLLF